MYLFVNVQESKRYYSVGPNAQIKTLIENISGERCLIVPNQEFDMNVVNEVQPKAIIMSGFGGHFQDMKVNWFKGMDEVFHNADIPMLNICGSHQILGFSYNKNLKKTKKLMDEPMRKIGPKEDFPRVANNGTWDRSKYFVAEGFFPITKIKADPIFKGLPKTMYMKCSHYCEMKKLPSQFIALASSQHCKLEAIRHKKKPIYGVQFHPEKFEAPFLDGQKLLENFIDIANNFTPN